MSTLRTLSQFFFGHTVTVTNRSLDFSEGGDEIQATLKVGNYSFVEYALELARAMNEVGSQLYSVAVNRTTGKITISAPADFELLAGTGSRIGTGVWLMSGFSATDRTGGNSYVSDQMATQLYRAQYLLKDYTSAAHYAIKESASVNISASGKVQTLQFGDGARIKMNIIAISNLDAPRTQPFYYNPTGEADFLAFRDYLITKGKVEFMPDFETPNVFVKMLLDSANADKNGVGLEMQNMKTPDFYESGNLVFRKVLT